LRRILVGLAAVVLLFIGCEKEEEPVRQLFFPEYTVGKTEVTAPAWFYPETGDVEYLCPDCPHRCLGNVDDCPEDVHGDACPFFAFTNTNGCRQVGEKLYYFTCEDVYGELFAYDLKTQTREKLLDTAPETVWRSTCQLRGEYLYQWDSVTGNNRNYKENIRRMHLPTGEVTDMNGHPIPWKVQDGTGYYLLTDSSPYFVSGIYSQPLYDLGENPPEKTLLLHEVDLGSYPLLEEDAVYWIGDNKLRDNPDVVVHDLYRLDRKTQEIRLLVENFGSSMPVVYGEYLYAVRHDETRNVLMQVHTTDGDQKILYVPEEGYRLKMTTLEIVGKYLIVDLQHDNGETQEKIWFDLETGERWRRTFPYEKG